MGNFHVSVLISTMKESSKVSTSGTSGSECEPGSTFASLVLKKGMYVIIHFYFLIQLKHTYPPQGPLGLLANLQCQENLPPPNHQDEFG